MLVFGMVYFQSKRVHFLNGSMFSSQELFNVWNWIKYYNVLTLHEWVISYNDKQNIYIIILWCNMIL